MQKKNLRITVSTETELAVHLLKDAEVGTGKQEASRKSKEDVHACRERGH